MFIVHIYIKIFITYTTIMKSKTKKLNVLRPTCPYNFDWYLVPSYDMRMAFLIMFQVKKKTKNIESFLLCVKNMHIILLDNVLLNRIQCDCFSD